MAEAVADAKASQKTWEDFTAKYRMELAHALAETVMDKCACLDEAATFLTQAARVIKKDARTFPAFSNPCLQRALYAAAR